MKEAQEFLSLFLENPNDIEYKEHTIVKIENYMGTLKSGDRILVSSHLQKYSTASFFLCDSERKYLVACQHILTGGEECFIEYSTFSSMTNIVRIYPVLQFEDIDIAVLYIEDSTIICKSGIRSDADSYFPFDGHVFSDDMMTLPIGSQVYKWGAGSGLTYGKFVGVSFVTHKIVGVIIEEDYARPFAQPGDSGSVICFKTEFQKVYAAFVLIGKAEDTYQQQLSHIQTYACIKVQNVLSHIYCSPLQHLHLSFPESWF